MADEIQVINSAFGLLAEQRITSLDDGSELAALAGLRYPLVRDAVLESHPWNFAMVRKALTRSAITPAFDWAYQYSLPPKPWCLTVRDTNDEGSGWEIGHDETDGRVLFSNNDTMQIRYTARIEDTGAWSPLAVMALTYLFASDFALAITGQAEKSATYLAQFSTTIALAITSDSREGSPVAVRAPTGLTGIRSI